MTTQPDTIPATLRQPAEQALAWINNTQATAYELTGLVDYEGALSAAPEASFELGLILCDGELCAREQVRVEPNEAGYTFSLVAAEAPDIPPLLDPPAGVRQDWLARALERHVFVVLLFYRGLW